MRNYIKLIGFFQAAAFLLVAQLVHAQVCNSITSGNWTSTFTWSCAGVNTTPTCGDTVYIASGDVVVINSQVNLEACGTPLWVDITGDLGLTNGNKLNLPCGSLLSLQTGGRVYKTTPGGGTSTLVSICSSTVWDADDGLLNGPTSFGGFILPVELLSFDVKELADDQFEFSWETATETNNDYFRVYAKTGRDNWEEITQVDGAGFSNVPQYYEHTKALKQECENLFMLEQTDFNGNHEVVAYAASVQIARKETEAQVWPNPTHQSVSIDASWVSDDLEVSVYSLDGSRVLHEKRKTNDVVTIHFSENNIKPGTYFVQLNDGRQQRSARVTYLP